MNRVESLFARSFLVLLSVLFTFILIEAAANFYLWNIAPEATFNLFASINQIKQRYGDDFFINSDDKNGVLFVPHQYLGYSLTPNLENGKNKHNSYGFRGDEFSLEKPENTYRIVALGASTTYSVPVEDYHESYPNLLGDYLRSNGYDTVEVINAGVGGYTSYESLINLEYRVLPLDPDLVIIYQGSNDIHTRFVYPYDKYSTDNSGYRAPFVSDTVMPEIWEYSTVLRMLSISLGITNSHSAIDWSRLRTSSYNYNSLFLRQYSISTYPSDIFTEVSAMDMLENNPPTNFERNTRNMIAMAQTQGVDVLLITFATSPQFDLGNVGSPEYIFGHAQHNEVTRDIAESTGTYFYDMAEVFPDDMSLFTDGRHMTVEGNQLRAQMIGDFIIESILADN